MRQTRKDTIRRAAARGAAWLDANLPGWSRSIKRRKLNMDSGSLCILGQIDDAPTKGYSPKSDEGYGYEHALHQLGLTDRDAERLGFILPARSERYSFAMLEAEYDYLTEAWRDELKTRPR